MFLKKDWDAGQNVIGRAVGLTVSRPMFTAEVDGEGIIQGWLPKV
jgi:hypothetical protein